MISAICQSQTAKTKEKTIQFSLMLPREGKVLKNQYIWQSNRDNDTDML